MALFHRSDTASRARRSWLLLPLAVAAVALLPMLRWGIPDGHDFLFHTYDWADAAQQVRTGILVPSWAAGANHNLGEPRFLFYPPLSWMLGTLLWLANPFLVIPGFIFISAFIAAASMRALAREWLSPRAAAVAGVLYGLNPYLAFDAYTRSAFGEFLAVALLPLLLLGYLRATNEDRRSLFTLAVAIALLWLSDVPIAAIGAYAVAVVAIVDAVRARRWRPILAPAAAALIAFGLAAWYLVPVLAEKSQIAPGRSILPASMLYRFLPLVGHQSSGTTINLLFLGGALVFFVSAALLFRRRFGGYVPMALLGGISIVMMLPPAVALWTHLPLLGFTQFPWRMLSVLSIADAVLLAALSERLSLNALKVVAIAALFLLIAVAVAVPHHWKGAAEIQRVEADLESGAGYLSSAEYWPAGMDMKSVNPPDRVAVTAGSAKVDVTRWTAEERTVKVDASSPSLLRFRLMYYPAWHAAVNGQPVEARRAASGLLELSIPPGQSEVRLHFVRTADRHAGVLASVVTWLGLIGISLRARRSADRRR